MLRPDAPLVTERLVLRPFTPDDLDDLYAYRSRPEVARYLYWYARDREQAYVVLEKKITQTELTDEGQCLVLDRIIGRCDPRDEPSWRLLERLGMRREAHFVQKEIFKGEWGDELVYAVLADEWRRQGAANT